MNEEKQIEEIARDLRTLDMLQHNPNYTANYQRAVGLHSLGYRKASEVVEEIIRILRAAGINEHRYPVIAEVRKKYTEERK